jgi:uncharacterized protein (TIGR00255 family)
MKSMTGMGKASGDVLGIKVRVEVKSVNHRFCEVNFRSSHRFSALDIQVQQFVKSKVSRGRLDIYLVEEKTSEVSTIELDAYKNYFNYLKALKDELKLQDEVGISHLLGGVGSWIQKEINLDDAWKSLKSVLNDALDDLASMRSSEGVRLKDNIGERFLTIEKIYKDVSSSKEDISQGIEKKITERIKEKVAEIGDLDPNRLQMEVVYYLDRMDITEELERIQSHLTQAEKFMAVKEPIGRKLDFLLQEFNREFNTIASKSQDPRIAHLVVDAKSELEKIREQIQNIE